MNRWKVLFLLLTGFWLHETLVHVWLGFEGMLPMTSKLFLGLTITPEMNSVIIFLNTAILLVCAYLGFMHHWGVRRPPIERHA